MAITLLLRYWKYIAGAALLSLLLWQLHSYGVRRYEAGKSHVQGKWNAAIVQAKAVADAETRKNELKDAADAARNIEVENAYRKNLAAYTADNRRLTGLLQRAIQTAAISGSAASPPDIPGTAPAGETRGAEPPIAETGLAADIAAVLTEARQNADQMDALIAEVKPQQ